MRAYVRTEWKRSAQEEAYSGLFARNPVETQPQADLMFGRGSEAWTRFLAAYSAAAGEDPQTLPLVHSLRFTLSRRQACGSEPPLVEAWSGSPLSPLWSRKRASQAVHFARENWHDEMVAVATIPVGRPGGLDLPSEDVVATVRTAWGRATRLAAEATGLTRLEARPLTVLTPDGLMLFLRGSWEVRELRERLQQAVYEAACHVGLPGVTLKFEATSLAVLRYFRALTLESERFLLNVRVDLARVSQIPWEGPTGAEHGLMAAARRWVGHVRHRQQSARRKVVFSSRHSLPAGSVESRRVVFEEASCPVHGTSCAQEAVVVRDELAGGRVVWRGQDPVNGQHTRQGLAGFFRRLAKRDEALELERTRFLLRVA